MSSQSYDFEGVNRVQRYLAQEFKKLGFTIELKSSRTDTAGDLLIASYKQKQKKLKYITLVCHADTVLGLDQFAGFAVSEDGKIAKGSGVIDDKGGLVVLLEGLREFLSLATEFPFHIRVVSSPIEEVGSTEFYKSFRKFSKDSFAVLGFEPALDDGSIISSRRGNRWYQISLTGKSAHAGRTKGEHINSAHEMALRLSKLVSLNNVKSEMSFNVAQLSGGSDTYNITCGDAQCKIDTRFAKFGDSEKIDKKIRQAFSNTKSKVKISISDDCPPFASNAKSKLAVEKLTQIISRIEKRKITARKAGGAGDVNYMSAKNLIVIDGLGPVGGALHTVNEFVHISSLATRSQALCQLLNYFCTEI